MHSTTDSSGNAEFPRHDASDPLDHELGPEPFQALTHRRAVGVVSVLAVVVLLALVPPLINVSRFRRQIASSISASLGRPVHIDSVALNALPMPGFTLGNFVVGEDPAFGAEPVIRANEVRATLRVRSLWRRRVEFSRISLVDPSVNLVHLGNSAQAGQWNIESILLQASRMPAAPTAQKDAGPAPRFPYIEATGARVNLKLDNEKTPYSLTEADFALWLPEPNQWRLRLKAHPARTDAAAMDTGLLRVDGTLSRATTLPGVPIDLTATWTAAPLGAISWFLAGRDLGLRGDMSLAAHARGTLGESAVESTLELRRVRRADFVPEHPLEADIACKAQSARLFHTFPSFLCAWPASSGATAGLTLTGSLPDLLDPASLQAQVALRSIPAPILLEALRATSSRISPVLALDGNLTGSFPCCSAPPAPVPSKPTRLVPAEPRLPGLTLKAARLSLPDSDPFLDSDFQADLQPTASGPGLVLPPTPLLLGGKDPALLTATLTTAGYTLHLTGPALPSRLRALASALPPFADGLDQVLPPAPTTSPTPELLIRLDLTSTRTWGSPATWLPTPPPPPTPRRRR